MDKERYGVHQSHCCVLHGCKYGDEDCPVESSKITQDHVCESCDYQNIQTVEEVKLMKMDKGNDSVCLEDLLNPGYGIKNPLYRDALKRSIIRAREETSNY